MRYTIPKNSVDLSKIGLDINYMSYEDNGIRKELDDPPPEFLDQLVPEWLPKCISSDFYRIKGHILITGKPKEFCIESYDKYIRIYADEDVAKALESRLKKD